MSSFFSNMRGFARGNSKNSSLNKSGNQSPTGFGQTLSPSQSSLVPSSSPSSLHNESSMNHDGQPSRRLPFFFREQWANLIVKGNFMTLAAKPVLIEEGEWLAHQVVEQCRLLDGMLKIIQEVDRNTNMTICNAHECPSMTAGPGVTYTWLDQNKQSVRVPAPQYIAYVQRWITGKITDPSLFPTDTSGSTTPNTISSATAGSSATNDNWLGRTSGFPASFASDIRNIYRQMFRCYAHAYHSHWTDFWHLGAYKELNTCFIHFVNVGRLFGLLNDRDLEPMGPLVDIWLDKGWLPRPSPSTTAVAAANNAASVAPASAASSGSVAAQGQGQAQQQQQSGSQSSLSPHGGGQQQQQQGATLAPPGSAGSGR